MSEWRLFEEGEVPEWSTPEWYAGRDRAPHLEEGIHLPRLELAATYARFTAARGAKTLVDLGAGDGGLLSLVQEDFDLTWGYDLQQTNVNGAMERGANVSLLDFVAETDQVDWADVAVCTETLEHLVDPHGFLRSIPEETRWLVASSPWNETDVSHYAYHLWAWDGDGYAALVNQADFYVYRHMELTSGFQVVLAGRP